MAQDPNRLIWIDLEMSGLNPDTDKVLEVAIVVTDQHLALVAEAPVLVVHQSEAVLDGMDQWNRATHHYIKETCLTCHSEWTEKQAVYVIDSLKSRHQAKLRQAEYQLTRFVDKFEEAKNLGVDDATLNKAREIHYNAHIHWEWWTASNGAAFHSPDESTASINKGIGFWQEGIKLLDEAMAKRRGEFMKTAAPAPAQAPVVAPSQAPAAPPAK